MALRRFTMKATFGPTSVTPFCALRPVTATAAAGIATDLFLGRPKRFQAARRLTRAIGENPLAYVQALRHNSTGNGPSIDDEEDEADSALNLQSTLQEDAKRERQRQIHSAIINELLPSSAPLEARTKLLAHLAKTPINDAIFAEKCIVTHVNNQEGEEVKAGWNMSRQEAMDKARELGQDLVQIASKGDVAYCRIRPEKKNCLKLVAHLLDASAAGQGSVQKTPASNFVLQDVVLYEISDVIDKHTVDWKTNYMIRDLKAGKPTKILIRKFQSPDTAIAKAREMLDTVKSKMTEKPELLVPHQATNFNVAEREMTVTLTPTDPAKGQTIRHPADKDWERNLQRFWSFRSDGNQAGTYVRNVKESRSNKSRMFMISKDQKVVRIDKQTAFRTLDEEMKAKGLNPGSKKNQG